MKEVIFLAAKRSPKRDKLGQEIPHDYKGNFRRRVAPNTPGAFHYSGTIAATGKAYDYWATEADIIRGYLRWVDVQTDKFGTSIALYVESDKFLFKIALDYDVMNLRQVANYVSGMKKELDTHFFNITYDAWKDKDKDGNYKLMDSGEPRWQTMLKFGDAKPFVDPKGMREYLEQKDLGWEKGFDASKNKDTYNQSKEIVFWLKTILAVQKHLLTTDGVLPFTYNSILACEAPHPSGCGNLDELERAACKNIYEAVRDQYRMPFGRQMEDADDVFSGNSHQVATEQQAREDAFSQPTRHQRDEADSMGFVNPANESFPNEEPPIGAVEGDDLPF